SDCDGRDVAASVAIVAEAVPPSDETTIAAKAPPEPAPEKPRAFDLVLVTLDTVRADRTSLYGHERDTTPHLKQLAERGLVFEHAYAVGSDTQRAITPLVSGRPKSRTPHTNIEWPRILDETFTVAERLRKAGY